MGKPSLASKDKTPSLNQTSTFDSSTALAGLYLWLIFGFLSSLLGCDLQRLINGNIFVKHLMALVAFFFLFSVIDQSNRSDIGTTWLKTIGVYFIFMLSIKSKNFTSVAFVLILIADQTIKMHMEYKSQNGDETNLETFRKIRVALFAALCIVASLGFVMYFIRQYADHHDDFNFITFFFGSNKCIDLS
jgi:hypothetical protein